MSLAELRNEDEARIVVDLAVVEMNNPGTVAAQFAEYAEAVDELFARCLLTQMAWDREDMAEVAEYADFGGEG